MIRVLLDGWPLVYEPSSPAALQAWALLAWRPPEIELYLALPGERPDWLLQDIQTIEKETKNTSWEHLAWEQRYLSRLGNSIKAKVLHTNSQSAPLINRLVCTSSPAYFPEQRRNRSLAEHLRLAIGQAGMSAVRDYLWPSDLPGTSSRLVACPPFVHPEFTSSANPITPPSIELPETFVLYHGPHDEISLRRLLSAWSWAAGPIGGYYPLVLPGLDATARDTAWALVKEYHATESVQILPELPTSCIPALYHRCTVLFHPSELSAWGDPVLHALACGRPIAAAATSWTSARTGSAAYLAPLEDSRALGAALITLVVEESIAERLAQAARQRFNTWRSVDVQTALRAAWNS